MFSIFEKSSWGTMPNGEASCNVLVGVLAQVGLSAGPVDPPQLPVQGLIQLHFHNTLTHFPTTANPPTCQFHVQDEAESINHEEAVIQHMKNQEAASNDSAEKQTPSQCQSQDWASSPSR